MKNYALKIGAIFGFISVITTLGVHLIPVQASTFEESVMLFTNSTYIFSRWWIVFHCIAVFISMTGVFIAINTPFNIHAKLGLMSFSVFSWTEIARMLLSLTYLFDLRRNYVEETDPVIRTILRTDIQNFTLIGTGLFTLFLLGFALGNLFYGIELAKTKGFGKWVGYLLIFWFATGMHGLYSTFQPAAAVDGFYEIFNITFQPAVRGLTAYWLLTQISPSK